MNMKSDRIQMLKKQINLKLSQPRSIHQSRIHGYLEREKHRLPACQQVSSFYCENFNIVDRFNSHWYHIKWPHSQKKDNVHATWALINVAIVNAWVAWCELQRTINHNKFNHNNESIVSFIQSLINDLGDYIERNVERRKRKKKRNLTTKIYNQLLTTTNILKFPHSNYTL